MIKRVFIAVLLLGFLIGSAFVFHFYRVFFASNTAFETPQREVLIPSTDTKIAAYDTLVRVVEHFDFFQQAARRKGYQPIPGRFVLDKGMNNNELINRLRSENKPIRLTFNNQKTLMHLAAYVAKKIETDSTAIMQAFYNADFLKENGLTQDNALSICLPNSYDVFWNTTAEQFRDRMLRQYKAFWTPKREAARKKIKLSRMEVHILASIVQREANILSEQKQIATVYLNRLKKRMRLQSCPTVIYAHDLLETDYNSEIRVLLYDHLKLKSPFNTYRNKGLPPGPIFMPEIATIDAVLFPATHNYYYFIVDPNRAGYHKYSTTFKTHLKNKDRLKTYIKNH